MFEYKFLCLAIFSTIIRHRTVRYMNPTPAEVISALETTSAAMGADVKSMIEIWLHQGILMKDEQGGLCITDRGREELNGCLDTCLPEFIPERKKELTVEIVST